MAQKRGPRGGGMIRLRSDGRWEARCTVGRDPGTGKQIQKSVYAKTQAEVRRKLNELTLDVDREEYADDRNLTLGKWMDIWYQEYTMTIKDTTRRSYYTIIEQHIKPRLGAVKLSKLTPLLIQRFYNDLSRSGRIIRQDRKKQQSEDPGLSARTVRNVHNVLHKALKQATKSSHRLIKFNPADEVELPKVVEREMSTLSVSEVGALLRQIKDDWHYPIYFTAMFCGMRRGEVLGLRWENVDFANQVIHVDGQLQRERKKGGKNRIVPLKNNRSRVIYPAASVFEVLKEHKKKQDQIRREVGSQWESTGAVFSNLTGGWLDASAVYNALMKHLKQIGITGVRFHDLRHTFAMLSLSEGVDLKTLQETLGHHDPGFTLRVYGHAHEEMKRMAAAKMEAFAKTIQHNG